jgi:hypothetical protein
VKEGLYGAFLFRDFYVGYSDTPTKGMIMAKKNIYALQITEETYPLYLQLSTIAGYPVQHPRKIVMNDYMVVHPRRMDGMVSISFYKDTDFHKHYRFVEIEHATQFRPAVQR